MKRIIPIVALIVTVLFSADVQAQKIKVIDGSLKALKGISKLNIEYDYSDMSVGKKKSESEYIKEKKAEYNKKEAGRGDSWEKSWVADRENRFQPQFEELFNKSGDVNGGSYPDAKYTLIFKTTRTEPGFNIHITRKNAEIDGEAIIVETADKNNIIARMNVMKCPGRTFGGYDYDSGTRIQEAYAVAGKGLGKFFKKQLK